MGNKVKYNLKNVHIARITKTGDEAEFDTPKAIPGAVSISLEAEGESTPFFADGIVYFRSVANNGYSGDLELAIVPDWFREEILNETLDSNGVLFETTENSEAEKFALLFEFDGDKNGIRHILYNCTATRPSIESETKEESIEPGTETLSIKCDPLNGIVKAKSSEKTKPDVYANWFKSVYKQKIEITGGSTSSTEVKPASTRSTTTTGK